VSGAHWSGINANISYTLFLLALVWCFKATSCDPFLLIWLIESALIGKQLESYIGEIPSHCILDLVRVYCYAPLSLIRVGPKRENENAEKMQ
jgi:hypothetical protein